MIEQCERCKEFIMPTFGNSNPECQCQLFMVLWVEDGDESEVYGRDHENVALKFAESWDDECDLVEGADLELVVTDNKGVVKTFDMSAEAVIEYHAKEIVNENNP